MNLQEIRDFVRQHIDIEEDDLPDAVLDVFIREGSKRIERAEKRWAFYAQRWEYTTESGTDEIPFTSIAADLKEIQAIKGPRWRLQYLGQDLADEVWPENVTSSSEPTHFSIERDTLCLWPTPNDAYVLQIRGYRTPEDWVAAGAGAEPDLPDDLHNTVATWALARAYAQQDDPEMASIYERQFADELNEFRRNINSMPAAQPIVLNGRSGPTSPGRLRFDWE